MEKKEHKIYSLTGSAQGTIFKNEEWLDLLFSCESNKEVAELLSIRFNNRFDFHNDTIFQQEKADWEEMYGLLSLFRKEDHLMFAPVTEGCFEYKPSRYSDQFEEFIKDGYIYANLKWISGNEIRVRKCLEQGYPGDEDGYGVEPDTWLVGTLNRNGNLKELYHIYE